MGSGFHSFWLSAFPGDGRQGPSLSPPVPSSTLTKIFEEDGGGLEGKGKLSLENFPFPLQFFPYPRPLNCRLSPTLMVTRSRSKYSRSGMTYLRERPPESSLNPAGSRSSSCRRHRRRDRRKPRIFRGENASSRRRRAPSGRISLRNLRNWNLPCHSLFLKRQRYIKVGREQN